MSLTKNWMKEDNIAEFTTRDEQRILNRLIQDCFWAMLVSSSGVMKYKQPGQVMQWYMKRLPPDEAEFIRKNFKAKHLNAGWDEFSKSCLQEIDNNDKAQKYPRRGNTHEMKKA